mmetsp:Transcript_13217/g.52988  ORF Transcript_13217/g.52988 Transcript_13217/m.52988 type:complete len:238 (-) Transcript_13217:1264-1977(-)
MAEAVLNGVLRRPPRLGVLVARRRVEHAELDEDGVIAAHLGVVAVDAAVRRRLLARRQRVGHVLVVRVLLRLVVRREDHVDRRGRLLLGLELLLALRGHRLAPLATAGSSARRARRRCSARARPRRGANDDASLRSRRRRRRRRDRFLLRRLLRRLRLALRLQLTLLAQREPDAAALECAEEPLAVRHDAVAIEADVGGRARARKERGLDVERARGDDRHVVLHDAPDLDGVGVESL